MLTRQATCRNRLNVQPFPFERPPPLEVIVKGVEYLLPSVWFLEGVAVVACPTRAATTATIMRIKTKRET